MWLSEWLSEWYSGPCNCCLLVGVAPCNTPVTPLPTAPTPPSVSVTKLMREQSSLIAGVVEAQHEEATRESRPLVVWPDTVVKLQRAVLESEQAEGL